MGRCDVQRSPCLRLTTRRICSRRSNRLQGERLLKSRCFTSCVRTGLRGLSDQQWSAFERGRENPMSLSKEQRCPAGLPFCHPLCPEDPDAYLGRDAGAALRVRDALLARSRTEALRPRQARVVLQIHRTLRAVCRPAGGRSRQEPSECGFAWPGGACCSVVTDEPLADMLPRSSVGIPAMANSWYPHSSDQQIVISKGQWEAEGLLWLAMAAAELDARG